MPPDRLLCRRADRHLSRRAGPHPLPLSDRQFGKDAQRLLAYRIETVFTDPPALFLAGRLLTPNERYDLLAFVQQSLLPEQHTDSPGPASPPPDFVPDPPAGTVTPATPHPRRR